jgi:hypothetical protein
MQTTNEATQIIDTAGAPHALMIDSTGMLLNGKRCRLMLKDTQITFISSDPTDEPVTVTPAALWHALAVGDPDDQAAGLAQASALMYWIAMQEMGQVMARLRLQLDALERQLGLFAQAPLPTFCFDAFTLQLLRTYDGTQEHLEALVRLLKQPLETVIAWLAKLGLITAEPEQEQQQHAQQAEACAEGRTPPEATPTGESREVFRWTPEMTQQLTAAFLASDELSVSEASRAIATRYGWPLERVLYKIYYLKLPQQRPQRLSRSALDSTQAQENQEDAAAPASPDVLVASGAENKQALSVLPSGPVLWDVRIGENTQRWQLGVPLGQFPLQPHAHFCYRDQEYRLLRAWHSMLVVEPVAASVPGSTTRPLVAV